MPLARYAAASHQKVRQNHGVAVFAKIRVTGAGECDRSGLSAGDRARTPDGGGWARRFHGILDHEIAFLGASDGEGLPSRRTRLHLNRG